MTVLLVYWQYRAVRAQVGIDTLRFNMFVFESKLRSSDANILGFDVCIGILDVYIVFPYVNV